MTVLTRRTLLAAAAVVLAGGGGSVAAALTRRTPSTMNPPTPVPTVTPRDQQLAEAVDRERMLIASIDAALVADPALHPQLDNIRADHVAHLDAITAAVGTALDRPSPLTNPSHPTASGSSTSPGSATSPGSPTSQAPTVAELRSAEQSANQAAATASAMLLGADAVLLASIAACEAGHSELLS
jgi:hypothetical protein